ncbi:unnamed protein product [Penicillium roqueforti FM164]|uniref:Genomic scaffold, ProqFM164S01 n=1 Tax=Penicillium roqueforti (strain FM164) TaxID=1365484 RepID=W6PZW2_PENRF|nr:unnamed protein product [Penicillium roqueforti FM164]
MPAPAPFPPAGPRPFGEPAAGQLGLREVRRIASAKQLLQRLELFSISRRDVDLDLDLGHADVLAWAVQGARERRAHL